MLFPCRRGADPRDIHVPLVRDIQAESAGRAGVPGRKKCVCYVTDTKGKLTDKRLISIAGATHVCDSFGDEDSIWVSWEGSS
jgi:hypothetical protein